MIEHDAKLKAALRQVPAPEPSPDLLPRILRSRAMGVRASLPREGLAVPWRWVGAAAAVAVLIGGSWMISLSLSSIGESAAGRDQLGELLRGMTRWPDDGDARESTGKLAQPRYPLILADALDLSRLTEGVWTYRSTTTTDGVITEFSFIGNTRIRMVRGTYNGDPAWIVTTARAFRAERAYDFGDTAYIDAATLRPRYAVAYGYKGRTRTVQTFSQDSGTQSITISGSMGGFYSGTMQLLFPPQAVFTSDWWPTRLRILFPAFPLARGWRGSLYQTGLFKRTGPGTLEQSAEPLDLRVRGRDRVTVPAGRFDCWRVEVENLIAPNQRGTMWVSRDQGWVVKAELRLTDRVITEVLESYEPGS
jgi:hypothetical protein